MLRVISVTAIRKQINSAKGKGQEKLTRHICESELMLFVISYQN